MIVFKGFHEGMVCTMGRGSFKYKLGVKATAAGAKTANTGLHSTREPFGILDYYNNLKSDVFCICEAGGDINEDEHGRVASTELTPLKKLTPQELALYEALFIEKHPEISNEYLEETARSNGYYAIARGKNPKAKGEKGSIVCLLQEYSSTKNIKKLEVFEIDGRINKAGWYGIGGRIDEKGDAEAVKNPQSNTGHRIKSKKRPACV